MTDWVAFPRARPEGAVLLGCDLDAVTAAPDRTRPWLLVVDARHLVREDRPARADASALLRALEADLTGALTAVRGRLVLRIARPGQVTFALHSAAPASPATLNRLETAYRDLHLVSELREDAEWEYVTARGPTALERRRLVDARVLENLEATGVVLEAPRTVRHAVSVPAASRDAAALGLQEVGYVVHRRPAGPLLAEQVHTLAADVLERHAEALIAIAAAHAGTYLGWDTDLVPR